jgi:hypothetical protein
VKTMPPHAARGNAKSGVLLCESFWVFLLFFYQRNGVVRGDFWDLFASRGACKLRFAPAWPAWNRVEAVRGPRCALHPAWLKPIGYVGHAE